MRSKLGHLDFQRFSPHFPFKQNQRRNISNVLGDHSKAGANRFLRLPSNWKGLPHAKLNLSALSTPFSTMPFDQNDEPAPNTHQHHATQEHVSSPELP
jgi:hypothetical protein